jgi:Tol biopolymer transport system component
VAVDVADAEGRARDIWVLDAASGVGSRLTFADLDALAPVWSPDGTRLAFAKAGGDDPPPDIVVIRLDGTGREVPLLQATGVQAPRHWSPDGELLLYEDFSAGRRDWRQLWLLEIARGKTRRVSTTPSNTYQGRFSPDGRRIAYVSDESGRPEIFLADASGGSQPRRVSHSGGVLPRFRGDGAELFFFQPDGMMMAVSPSDETAAPRSLFHIEGVSALDFDYDVARDGRRFLVRLAPGAEGAAGLRVALEWSQLLGRAEGR